MNESEFCTANMQIMIQLYRRNLCSFAEYQEYKPVQDIVYNENEGRFQLSHPQQKETTATKPNDSKYVQLVLGDIEVIQYLIDLFLY